jgi:hypothetical protein
MAQDVLHYPFKGNVHKKEKNSPNIYFEVFMKEKMAPSADAHKNIPRKRVTPAENFKVFR